MLAPVASKTNVQDDVSTATDRGLVLEIATSYRRITYVGSKATTQRGRIAWCAEELTTYLFQ